MYSNSYNFKSNSKNKTLQKCQKILSLFEELQPKKIFPRQSSSKKQNIPYYISQSSKKPSVSSYFKNSQNTSVIKRQSKNDLSFMRKSVPKIETPSRSRTVLKQLSKNSQSFVSAYKKQTRYDKIMKLKVKPTHKKSTFDLKKSLLNSSFNSLNSSRSSMNNKQNRNNNKESRLQKIMKIKIEKPKVNSTLINYYPLKGSKSSSKKQFRDRSLNSSFSLLEHKQSKKIIKNKQRIEQKQQRLWKQFERERELHQKQKRIQQKKYEQQQKRIQKKFQIMVQKQLKKISTQKQTEKRKRQGFSAYMYPAY